MESRNQSQFQFYESYFLNQLNLLSYLAKPNKIQHLSFNENHILPWNESIQQQSISREGSSKNVKEPRMRNVTSARVGRSLKPEKDRSCRYSELKMAQTPVVFDGRTSQSRNSRRKIHSLDVCQKEAKDIQILIKNQANPGYLRSLNGQESFIVAKSPRLLFLERKFKLKQNNSRQKDVIKEDNKSKKVNSQTTAFSENQVDLDLISNKEQTFTPQRRPSTARRVKSTLKPLLRPLEGQEVNDF